MCCSLAGHVVKCHCGQSQPWTACVLDMWSNAAVGSLSHEQRVCCSVKHAQPGCVKGWIPCSESRTKQDGNGAGTVDQQ